jgi:hypothetical protein
MEIINVEEKDFGNIILVTLEMTKEEYAQTQLDAQEEVDALAKDKTDN